MSVQREPENWSEPLYNRYAKSIQDFLVTRSIPALKEALEISETALLKEWVNAWVKQIRIANGLSKMFMYLVSVYVFENYLRYNEGSLLCKE
jgi:hypothetical protein